MIQLDLYTHCIIALDLALENTGYCILKYNLNSRNKKIIDSGTIHTDSSQSDEARIRFVLESLMKLYTVNLSHKNQKAVFIIEKPPETLYQNGFMSKNAIIGKCTSIFKLMSMYGAVVSLCIQQYIDFIPVLPSQWQASKKQRKGADIKQWSISSANRILKENNFNKFLKFKNTEHEADAINIMFSCLPKIAA